MHALVYSFQHPPIPALPPQVTMKHMRDIIGYKNGDSILAPGGSVSNLYAALAARHKMFPEYKKKGLRALPGELVMFTSLHVSPHLTFASTLVPVLYTLA